MKLITFAVPCYNSQDYMEHCLETLLTGGEDVEIIIVNDGSKDNTAAIADKYVEKYPTIVKAVHKENGGHGTGVNTGLKNATGLYYKVVDSDDWVDTDALKKLLDTIKQHLAEDTLPDLYITNYVYEHVADNTQNVRSYQKQFPVEKFCTWDEVKPFHWALIMLMHSLLYKTDVLRRDWKDLPAHTFYVDDIYMYVPLPRTRKLYYLNVDLYRYFIGRADQSVNLVNMSKRYDQQIRVMEFMADAYTLDEINAQPKGLRKYMMHVLRDIVMTTEMFVTADVTPERKQALKNMWAHIKEKDKKLYKKMRYGGYPLSIAFLPFRLKNIIMLWGYKIITKIVKLG